MDEITLYILQSGFELSPAAKMPGKTGSVNEARSSFIEDVRRSLGLTPNVFTGRLTDSVSLPGPFRATVVGRVWTRAAV